MLASQASNFINPDYLSCSTSEKEFIDYWIHIVFDNIEKRKEEMEFLKVHHIFVLPVNFSLFLLVGKE